MDGAVTMAGFARVATAVGATGSKIEKVRLLAAYLRGLDRERLAVATRYFAGRAFASWDPRVLSIGGAAFRAVLIDLAETDDAGLGAAWARHADAGDVALEMLARAGHGGGGPGGDGTDLLDVARGLEGIAAATKPAGRAAALRALLERCTPDEARYVVKIIFGELRIGLREGLVEEAIGRAFDREPAMVARADMLAGDLGEVAVLALQDRLGDAAPRVFAPLRFMLASPVADAGEVVRRLGAEAGDEVWVEDKYDGIRCQLHHDAGEVRLYSRDLKTITEQFPEVAEAAALLPDGLILDGEVLGFRDGRVLPFSALQTRLGRRSPAAAVRSAVPVVYVAWDVLHLGGEALLTLPLHERRAALEGLRLQGTFGIAHLERARGAARVDELFDEARGRRNEGLMIKDPGSPYLPGRRGLHWLKLKRPLDTLDVVVTGAEFGHGRRRGVLSDVTFAVRVDGGDELVTLGKAYTGLTDAEIREMTALLIELTVQDMGHFRTVAPRIVLEVAFDAVQVSKRHRSGYALRFPRIVRRRYDKSPSDIDVLSRVAAIARAGAGEREQRVDQA